MPHNLMHPAKTELENVHTTIDPSCNWKTRTLIPAFQTSTTDHTSRFLSGNDRLLHSTQQGERQHTLGLKWRQTKQKFGWNNLKWGFSRMAFLHSPDYSLRPKLDATRCGSTKHPIEMIISWPIPVPFARMRSTTYPFYGLHTNHKDGW